MHKKVFIACDTTNLKKVQKIIKDSTTDKLNIGYKFGLEFFYSRNGRSFLSKIDVKKNIFLDLKLNDIPNTCASAISQAAGAARFDEWDRSVRGGTASSARRARCSGRIAVRREVVR